MTDLMHFQKLVATEKQFITQILFKLVQTCNSVQEMRDALPECLVIFEPYMAKLTRTRKPAWTIEHVERDMKQYLKLMPKIESYCAMRYLY